VIALTRPAANSDSVVGFDEFAPERDGVAIIRAAAMPADHAQISVAGLLMMGEQGAARADAVKRGHSLPLLSLAERLRSMPPSCDAAVMAASVETIAC